MKVCVYGAGAVGGWIGVGFGRSGAKLSAVARGRTFEALNENGLTLVRTEDGEDTYAYANVDVAQDPSSLGQQDVVIVSVKAPSLEQVAKHVAPLLGPETIVLTAMNGVPWWFLNGTFGGPLTGQQIRAADPNGIIAEAIPRHQVVGSVVHASCSLDAPGVVRLHSGNTLIVGEPGSVGISTRVQSIVDQLVCGGIMGVASPAIQRDVWYKLWGNMTINPISAITGATADRIVNDEQVHAFAAAIMREAMTIGEQLGITIDESPEDRLNLTRKIGTFKTSMLQDVEARRPVELDALLSSVRELGHRLGLQTPNIDALWGLARVHAQVLGLY